MNGRLYLVFILVLAQSIILSAQDGTLRGKVIDAETGEALIGATVVVTGTTNGTITDFDGNYTLMDMDPGTVSITIQYVSYEPQVFQDLDIADLTTNNPVDFHTGANLDNRGFNGISFDQWSTCSRCWWAAADLDCHPDSITE